MAYEIEYSNDAIDHLRHLTARQRSILFDAVDEQLANQPNVETRNRKLMRPNPLAVWELRIEDLRAYYDIDESKQLVIINAIGIKRGNIVWIGGEEVPL